MLLLDEFFYYDDHTKNGSEKTVNFSLTFSSKCSLVQEILWTGSVLCQRIDETQQLFLLQLAAVHGKE